MTGRGGVTMAISLPSQERGETEGWASAMSISESSGGFFGKTVGKVGRREECAGGGNEKGQEF